MFLRGFCNDNTILSGGGGTEVSNTEDKDQKLTTEDQTVDVEKILEKYDRESVYRRLTGFWKWVISLGAVAFSAFQLYTAAFGVYPAQIQRSVHMAFMLFLVFLLYPVSKKSSRTELHWADVVLALLGVAVGAYIVVEYTPLMYRAGLPTTLDLVFGALAILLVLEAARRIVGLPIVIVAAACLLYALYGNYIPGMFGHRGFPLRRVITHMYVTTEGLLGLPMGVSATFVFMFILFGAFLHKTGLGKFFINLAMAVTGHQAGGPAKIAVVASCMFGTISGSSVANVVTTGTFTIPLMKSIGYEPHFAGAVEAAASTGGQIMPPIMGAAAFVMSEFIGVPYIRIAAAAIVPAILYYLAVFVMVHMEALRLGLKGLPRELLPNVWETLKDGGHLLIPVAVLVYLLVKGYTPLRAALVCIIVTVVIAMMRKNTRLKPLDLYEAMENGARSALGVASACACSGLIIGVVTLTGLGLKIANGIIYLAGGVFFLTLLFTMLASILLGMGLPTTAKYIVLASMAAPAIQKFGVPPIAAHMFILYYGIIADLTPPVALAAYAGAGIAGANPMKTGWTAVKLALAGFLIPYIFAYEPVLLLIGATPLKIIGASATAIIGVFALGFATSGYWLRNMALWERVVLFGGALALIKPGVLTDCAGILIMVSIYVYQRLKVKRESA